MNPNGEAPDRSNEPYGAFAYVYDQLMADMPYGEWLGWLDAYWAANGRPAAVADLGCGTGTIAIPLAREGLNVTGIDLSEDMLAVARHKEASMRSETAIPGKIRWLRGDMREWKLPERVDGVVSLCDSLNYLLSEDDLLRVFRQTYDGLADGGTFLFDMHHPNHLEEMVIHEPFCLESDEVSYIWTCTMEQALTISHRLVLFVKDGETYNRIVEHHKQRAYSEAAIRELLAAAGFQNVESYADFTFEPVDDAAAMRMFFAARRQA